MSSVSAVTPASTAETVSIRPGVSILSLLQHVNYQPWFAMAERKFRSRSENTREDETLVR